MIFSIDKTHVHPHFVPASKMEEKTSVILSFLYTINFPLK